MDNVSSSNLTIVWTMYHEIAMPIGLWKNGWIENCFLKSWNSNQTWKLSYNLACNLLFHIVGVPSSPNDYKSKFNIGSMNVLSQMKTWHMVVLRLDKTLIIFWLVSWIFMFLFFKHCNYSMKVCSFNLFWQSLISNYVVLRRSMVLTMTLLFLVVVLMIDEKRWSVYV
jgi:hypothetical protein